MNGQTTSMNPQQFDLKKSSNKLLTAAAIAGFLIAAILVLACVLPMSNRLNHLYTGFDQGFSLGGSYTDSEARTFSFLPAASSETLNIGSEFWHELSLEPLAAAILDDDSQPDGIWQISSSYAPDKTQTGYYRHLDNPNAVVLYDTSGKEIGHAQLAYAERSIGTNAANGKLYIALPAESAEFAKTSTEARLQHGETASVFVTSD